MIFDNKTVLITGASSGIGEEFAIQLAEAGANLILTARSEDRLEDLAQRLKATNPKIWVEAIPLDLCESQSVKSLHSKISRMNCSVDYLINNAGAGRFCHFIEEDYDTYRKMIDLNISALTELTYAFLPDMKEKNAGGIIHVASIASFQPLPYQAVYGATKAYVLSFSEALSGELLDSNVHIMALCPGITESNFMKTANADTSKMKFATASHVVSAGLTAYKNKRIYTVSGLSNYLTSFVPRLLSRLRTIKIVANMFKDGISNA